MKHSFKLLSLALLTGLATGIVAKRKPCDCDKKERTHCKKICCNKKLSKKDCKSQEALHAFECCLSFEQTVVGPSDIGPRNPQDKPEGVCGAFKICFAQDFSEAHYELTISGLDIEKYPNQRPLGASLRFGSSTEQPIKSGLDIIAELCGLTNPGSDKNDCTTPNTQYFCSKRGTFSCKAKLTNEHLNRSKRVADSLGFANIPTLAALFSAIKAGKIFVLINGGACDTNSKNPIYDVESGGLIRCHLCGKEVSGIAANGTPD